VEALHGASEGHAVRFIASAGWLEFRAVGVPTTSTYRVTIVYGPGSRPRSAWLAGVGLTFEAVDASGQLCCREVSREVTLSAGATLRIDWSGWISGRHPAIDRIVIASSG
jgi:hypothetical protein